ncbi:hypothetical protein [Desulfosporosinus sp.]|uniref:hypothetical protein n=1 Tax=Desulfosporosinus sp. TaxID=157907 RepID=UPI0023139B8E|nr:hypothetical protein [Desulfosporosinus sp.]MDA8220940.1 hypothetical protein [Desulfitobacterium hafniense]
MPTFEVSEYQVRLQKVKQRMDDQGLMGELLSIIKPFGFTEDNLPKGITVKKVIGK